MVYQFTKEHRANISKALKGRIRTDEHCKNISKAKKGKKDKQITRKRKSDFWKNKWQEKGYKEKIIAQRKKRGLSEEHKQKLYEGRLRKPAIFTKKALQKKSKSMKKWWQNPENKARMSEKFKKKKLSPEHKAKLTFKGRKHTKEAKKKIGLIHNGKFVSEATKDKLSKYFGKKAAGWKGGSWRYFNFSAYRKRKIKDKYNNQCAICNDNKNICIHHVDFDPKNSNDDNLVVLCRKCHRKTHNRKIRINMLGEPQW